MSAVGRRYVAVAERTGQWWAITVPEVPGVFTQARRLDGPSGAGAMVRDALALMLDIPADQIDIEVRPQLPEDLDRVAAQVREARAEADVVAAAATRAAADLARRLTAAGISVRDAGAVMGLSPQRVSQLAQRPADEQRAAS
ncbi:MAG: hypothetical protein HYR62_02185 [Actinobacteria bacterium]|nr:hypothetical protein [Actinomycetota bacterium]MBI3687289.1 hypothetical protein [Actinomycetota bacterium]